MKLTKIMKTNLEWNKDIRAITLKIRKEYPELTKYIEEMPSNNSEFVEINGKSLEDYYNSLEEIVSTYAKTHPNTSDNENEDKTELSGYPTYPISDDIYSKAEEEKAMNPEDLSKVKSPNERLGARNEKDFGDNIIGEDLDVPGSELDDQQESIGSEDEENNYYSLGADDHHDLEEDKG
jgi:hypothetical protein